MPVILKKAQGLFKPASCKWNKESCSCRNNQTFNSFFMLFAGNLSTILCIVGKVLDPGLGRESGSGRATSVAPVGGDRMLSFMSSGKAPCASQMPKVVVRKFSCQFWRRKSLKAMAACAHALLQLLRVTGTERTEVVRLLSAKHCVVWPGCRIVSEVFQCSKFF